MRGTKNSVVSGIHCRNSHLTGNQSTYIHALDKTALFDLPSLLSLKAQRTHYTTNSTPLIRMPERTQPPHPPPLLFTTTTSNHQTTSYSNRPPYILTRIHPICNWPYHPPPCTAPIPRRSSSPCTTPPIVGIPFFSKCIISLRAATVSRS